MYNSIAFKAKSNFKEHKMSDIKYGTSSFKRAFEYASDIRKREDKEHKILSLKIRFIEDSENDCANFYKVELVYLFNGKVFRESGKFYED